MRVTDPSVIYMEVTATVTVKTVVLWGMGVYFIGQFLDVHVDLTDQLSAKEWCNWLS